MFGKIWARGQFCLFGPVALGRALALPVSFSAKKNKSHWLACLIKVFEDQIKT